MKSKTMTMKTSSYIILSFLVFLFGGIFVLFTAAKIHSINEPKVILTWQEKPISPFSVVVAEPGAEVNVKYEQNSRIGLSLQKGDSCIYPPFEIRNDTLFVHPYVGKVKQRSVFVLGDGIKTIQGKENSTIWIKQFEGDTLVLKLNDAKLQFFPDKFNFKKFSCIISANRSTVEMGSVNFDQLDVNLNQTQMNTNSIKVSNFLGVLKDHSTLLLSDIKRINLESDSTSTYKLNN